ncbi:ankyrin repeat domain-containing protein [Citrobacter freundii]|uniref:ankyrin repeat domain-containing protein n=1 Tax=Citrobacter freundii TaxID=546 RepID=UPI002021CCE3|nr:ankyrin repeat domain-containing protein [Citrobacter freundii]
MMNKKLALASLKIATLIFTLFIASCDAYEVERNLSLISVASSPLAIRELKERWFFCDRCLKNNMCKQKEFHQCSSVTIKERNEALSLAVESANIEAVHFLVEVAQADVNSITGRYNETPLIIAAYYGTAKHRDIANYLLSHGANVDAIAKSPIDTALITATWKNNIIFAKLLLEKGANPSLSDVGLKEGYACRYAIQKKQAEILPSIPSCCSLVEQNPHWITEVGYFCP